MDAWNRAANSLGIERSEVIRSSYERGWRTAEWCEVHPWSSRMSLMVEYGFAGCQDLNANIFNALTVPQPPFMSE